MKKGISIFNFITVIAIIYWNYLAGTGQINGQNIGEISNDIDSLFTPASYAFSIWGIIYSGLLINAAWLIIKSFKEQESETILKQSIWVSLANIASGFWLYFWLYEEFMISVFFMLSILLFLMIAVVKLKMEKWDAPANIIGFVWWPISIYSGWITVATITNIAAYLKLNNFSLGISEPIWTIVMIVIASLLFIYFLYTRFMREFTAVAVWAFIAIAVKQFENFPSIAISASIAATVLTILSLIQGFRYRKQNPFFLFFFK